APMVRDDDTASADLVFGADGLPVWLTLDPATGAVTGDSTGRAGPFTFTLRVTDPDGNSAAVEVTLRVVTAPILLPIADLVLLAGGTLDLVAEPESEGSGDLVFTLQDAPDWLAIDAATGRITGTDAPAGRFEVTVRATDAEGLFDERSFALRVMAVPVLEAIEALRLVEGAAVAVRPVATDADTDAADLRFSATGLPGWLTLDALTGAIDGDSSGRAGSYAFTLTVTDPDGLSASREVSVRVLAVPVLAGLPTRSVRTGVAFEAQAEATDADTPAEDLRYALDGAPHWLTIDTVTGRISGTAGDAAAHSVTVIVTDPDGLEARTTFGLRVTAPPVIADFAPVRLTEGAPLSVMPDVTDPDGDPGELRFRMLSGPDWISVDPETGQITGDTTGRARDAAWAIEVEVEDGDGQTATATMSLTVAAAVAPPPPPPGGGGGGGAGALIALPIALLGSLFQGGSPAPTDPSCAAAASVWLVSGKDLRDGGVVALPLMLDSIGGIRSVVIEVAFDTGTVSFAGLVRGDGLPPGTRVTQVTRTEAGRTIIRITIVAPTGMAAGAVELAWLRLLGVNTGGQGLAAANITMTTIEINGENVCAPPRNADDRNALLVPPQIDLVPPTGVAVAAAAALDLWLGDFAASVAAPALVDPAETEVLPLRLAGFGNATSVEVRLAWDADAFTPYLASGPAGSDLTPGDVPGTARLTLPPTGELALALVAVAQIGLIRAAAATGQRRIGRIIVAGVTVDGVNLTLTEADPAAAAGWTAAGEAAIASEVMQFAALTIPFGSGSDGTQVE
ncbi:MAG TPA: putative Ig domain-containing protein, partial [Paracoccaceae bacterium]|nr:putative Ig domain-containing protein [Paracoccaceae bacterium]